MLEGVAESAMLKSWPPPVVSGCRAAQMERRAMMSAEASLKREA